MDNQEALKALWYYLVKSKQLKDCKLKLFGMPGHIAVEDNEITDEMPKQGSAMNIITVETCFNLYLGFF